MLHISMVHVLMNKPPTSELKLAKKRENRCVTLF